jgi:hypothetical protein
LRPLTFVCVIEHVCVMLALPPASSLREMLQKASFRDAVETCTITHRFSAALVPGPPGSQTNLFSPSLRAICTTRFPFVHAHCLPGHFGPA